MFKTCKVISINHSQQMVAQHFAVYKGLISIFKDVTNTTIVLSSPDGWRSIVSLKRDHGLWNIASRFTRNSEVPASEFLENLEAMLLEYMIRI